MNDATTPKPRLSKPVSLWMAICGFGSGLFTLSFFMFIVLRERTVPCDRHFLVIIVLALGTAMATAFIGGWMTAKGSLPIAAHSTNVIKVSAGGGLAVLIVLIGLGVRFYTCSPDPCPSRTAVDQLVDDDATAIGTLRGTAENRDIPGWRSMVRSEGLRLSTSIRDPAEGRLLPSRKIVRHEYRAWALLMVARTYLEPGESEDESRHARLFYASEALSDIDQALAKMSEIKHDHENGDECATKVYRWMTGHSEDLPRTRYLRVVALAAVAQAGGKATKDLARRELVQLGLEFPVYLETYPPKTNPFLAWLTQPAQQ
jgi:hypothetical protein